MNFDVEAGSAIDGFMDEFLSRVSDVIGAGEIISGCEILDMNPDSDAPALPRWISARINEFSQPGNVQYRGFPPGLSVGDFVTVSHMREANRYEVIGAGGSGGSTLSLELYDENPVAGYTAPAATGDNAVAIGDGADASGDYAKVSGGQNNEASGDYSLASGEESIASGDYGVALGSYSAADKHGQMAHAAGTLSGSGDTQRSVLVARGFTVDGNQTEIFLDGSTLRCTLGSDSTWLFRVEVVARRTLGAGGEESGGWIFQGLIDSWTGSTSLAGDGVFNQVYVNKDIAAWDVDVDADDANDALRIRVTGEVGKLIWWVATIWLTEINI